MEHDTLEYTPRNKIKPTWSTGAAPTQSGAMCRSPVIGSEWVVITTKNRDHLIEILTSENKVKYYILFEQPIFKLLKHIVQLGFKIIA